MKIMRAGLALGLGLLAATAAEARDWAVAGGSVKDLGLPGTPVPAPIPVPEHFRWYVRADLGIGFYDKPTISESGLTYGETDSGPLAPTPFGSSSSWFSSEFDTFVSGGLGAGLYITPRVRGDITVDARTMSDVNVRGSYSYDQYSYPGGVPTATGNRVLGNVQEQVQARAVISLANLYYDFGERGRFSPYIGVGGGFAVRSLDRRHNSTEADYVILTGLQTGATRTASGKAKEHDVAPAFALTAGASYPITAGTVVDVNYRFTWVGSAELGMNVGNDYSRLKIGDTMDHQVRAGLRWNIW